MKFSFLKLLSKLKIIQFISFFTSKNLNKKRIKIITDEEYDKSLNYLNNINFYDKKLCHDNHYIKYEKETNYDLDIIVPIYNVERYVSECIKSIVNQKTSYKIRMIIINDGSNDKSMEFAKEILKYSTKDYIIISQKNQGLASARNTGLVNIDSKYLMFVDSDDVLAENAVESLLNIAFENDCDCVQGQYVNFTNGHDLKFLDEEKTKDVDNDLYRFAWGKIFKSSLWENVRFPNGLIYEDTIIKFFIGKILKNFMSIKSVVYYYRKNMKSISFKFRGNKKTIDTVWSLFYVIDLLQNYSIKFNAKDYPSLLNHIKLSMIRLSYLDININKAVFNVWRKLLIDWNFFDKAILDKKTSILQKYILTNCFYRFKFFCF